MAFRIFRCRMNDAHTIVHARAHTDTCAHKTQGLRIAPPEAPVSGYFLGKGIYLADVFSKVRRTTVVKQEIYTYIYILRPTNSISIRLCSRQSTVEPTRTRSTV